MFNKKSQTEVFGLMVIVILIIFIGLVYLTFTLKSPKEQRKIQESTEISNLMNSMMKYTPICTSETQSQPKSIKIIVSECTLNNPISVCNAPCTDFLKTEIEKIIKASLDSKTKFSIIILKTNQQDPLIKINENICQNKQSIANNYISLNMQAKIKLC